MVPIKLIIIGEGVAKRCDVSGLQARRMPPNLRDKEAL